MGVGGRLPAGHGHRETRRREQERREEFQSYVDARVAEPGIYRGRIVGGDALLGWDVVIVGEDGVEGPEEWSGCRPWPPDGSVEIDQYVHLRVTRPGSRVEIMVTGGTSGTIGGSVGLANRFYSS